MHRYISSVLLLVAALVASAFAETKSPVQERADQFLALANAGYQAVYRVNSEAQWTAVTDVTPEHDAAAEATGKAFAAFNGNPAIIKEQHSTGLGLDKKRAWSREKKKGTSAPRDMLRVVWEKGHRHGHLSATHYSQASAWLMRLRATPHLLHHTSQYEDVNAALIPVIAVSTLHVVCMY